MDSGLLKKLEEFSPIHDFHFGHTPTQIAFFKTAQQAGYPEFEYYHHVLQLKSLYGAIQELGIQKKEVEWEIQDAYALWPPWTWTKRKRSLPRLYLRLSQVESSLKEKEWEAAEHLRVVDSRYGEFKELTEEQILTLDKEYWEHRLSRQLSSAFMARQLGLSEAELQAVLALPPEQQKRVLETMNLHIDYGTALIKGDVK